MKIGKEIYYQLYISVLKHKINKAEEDMIAFKVGYNNLIKNLAYFRPYIKANVSTDYVILLVNPPSKLKGSLNERYGKDGVLYTKSDFMFHYIRYRDAHKRFKKHQEYLKGLKKKLISLKLYTKIIKKFNLKVADRIIFNSYKFNLGYGLGALFLGRSISKRKQVDWDKSNANRDRIIANGGTPYLKEDALHAEALGEEYNGEEWLEYHDPENVWVKHNHTDISSYKFELIKSNKSRSLKYFLIKLRNSVGYNPKNYPLVDY